MESWRHRGSTPTSCVSGRLRWRWRPVATRHQARALARIGKQLGINPETLQNWVPQAEIDEGTRAGTARAEAKSSDEHLTWTDVTVRRLRHDAQRCRLVGGRTAGSL
jgi:transposase-like protein